MPPMAKVDAYSLPSCSHPAFGLILPRRVLTLALAEVLSARTSRRRRANPVLCEEENRAVLSASPIALGVADC